MDVTIGSSAFISPVFLLLLALPPTPSAFFSERCNISGDIHIEDDICLITSYTNSTGVSDSVISAEDIEFILRDSTNGILEVKFPILRKYVTYELRLNVIEQARNSEECNTHVDLNDYSLHSIRFFDVYSCKDDLEEDHCDSPPPCTKFTSVTFSHVFGGCYLLHITPKNNSSSGQPTTRRLMINSEHKKTLIWNMKPSVADQSYPDELRLSISNFTVLCSAGLRVRFILYLYDDCDDFGDKKQEWVLVLADNSTLLQCETIKDGYQPNCELVTNRSNTLNSVACTFYNMTPGQYCVILEPIERDRCNPGTVWTRGLKGISPCKYQHIFTFRKKNFNQTPLPSIAEHDSSALIVVGSVGALAAFVILGLAMYSGLHYSFPGSASTELSARRTALTTSRINAKPHVLLLYAQDCLPFMKLMGTLRSLLSHVGKCEVFDYFDPACAEYVAPAPEDWIQRAVSICHVIIVINDCGTELQKRPQMLQYYRYPLPYCHLYLAGLRHIMSSLSSREYCRLFVIRFDNQDMNCVTPHIRFLLPNNLCDLLRHLNPSCETTLLEDCKDHQKLSDDIEAFLHFKKENPNYLKTLLILEENH